jgi:Siphovirus ReqiPepy6 Gp37-like protein
MWTARVRTAAHALTDPFLFSELTLVERYGQPDSLLIVGQIDDLRPAMDTNTGVVLTDDNGVQRFSGVPPQLPKLKVERRGNGTATLTYDGDLVHLWDRYCWPTPAAAWNAQTTAYDVQTAVHETRIIGYITRNAGSTAYNSGANDRRVPHIRIPTTLGRGVSGKTSTRFQNLGQLVAELAEAANLRVTIQQTYTGTTPFLDVVIDDVPDYSTWARFGDAKSGDLGFLSDEWRYGTGPGVSVVLSAAGGELENRLLTLQQDTSRETAQGRRIEFLLDQRDTTDSGEISQRITTAMAENAPTVEVEAPIIPGDFEFGPGSGNIPVGTKVSVSLDGEILTERIRQLTTTLLVKDNEATAVVEPLFGTPDAGLTIDQKALRRALRRLINLERSL